MPFFFCSIPWPLKYMTNSMYDRNYICILQSILYQFTFTEGTKMLLYRNCRAINAFYKNPKEKGPQTNHFDHDLLLTQVDIHLGSNRLFKICISSIGLK